MDNQKEFEIDLLELLHYLKKKIAIILVAFAACALVSFLINEFFVTPQYTASTRVYILNRSNESALVSSDFTLSNYMLNDYKVLITGRNVTDKVVKQLGLDMSAGTLTGKISVSAENNTRVLQISVTDTVPQRAADIANSVREEAAKQIKEIMDVDAVNLVYAAEAPMAASSPNVMGNTLLAAFIGLAVTVVVLTVIFVMDDAIRTEEDVERHLGLGTLGVIPVSGDLANEEKKVTKPIDRLRSREGSKWKKLQ